MMNAAFSGIIKEDRKRKASEKEDTQKVLSIGTKGNWAFLDDFEADED